MEYSSRGARVHSSEDDAVKGALHENTNRRSPHCSSTATSSQQQQDRIFDEPPTRCASYGVYVSRASLPTVASSPCSSAR